MLLLGKGINAAGRGRFGIGCTRFAWSVGPASG